MTAAYQPQDGSVASRVISYFRRLPDEELSNKDIALKFDCNAHEVAKLLARAVDAQFLNRDGSIYSAGHNSKADLGPALHQGKPAGQAHTGKAFGGAFPPPAKVRKTTTHFDIATAAATLQVNDGPLPDTINRGAQDKWGPLFQRLKEVGQWFSLPIEARGPLGAAITKQHKRHAARYARTTTTNNEIVVQRVK